MRVSNSLEYLPEDVSAGFQNSLGYGFKVKNSEKKLEMCEAAEGLSDQTFTLVQAVSAHCANVAAVDDRHTYYLLIICAKR